MDGYTVLESKAARAAGSLSVPPVPFTRSFVMTRKTFGLGVVLTVLTCVLVVLSFKPFAEVQAQAPAAAGYSIVDTDGTSLVVVDNSTHTLYFYTVEPGKEVGDDLHLRGSLDLKEVGKPVITPKKAK
jgi:hypothetical protein